MKRVFSIILLSFLAGCNPTAETKKQGEASAADLLKVTYQVLTNRSDQDCDPKQTEGKCFQARITLSSPVQLSLKNWSIYFSHMSPVQMDSSVAFDIEHINGDLHKITPTAAFTGFAANQEFAIDFKGGFWHLSQTDMMPNYYLVEEGKDAQVILSTVPKIDQDSGLELLPHAVALSLEDKHFKRSPDDLTSPATANWLYKENAENYVEHAVVNSILPTPKSVMQPRVAGSLDLSKGIKLKFNGMTQSGVEAALNRLEKFGVKQSSEGIDFTIHKNENLAPEQYRLSILPTGINIDAATDTGAFYALQSISSLLMPNSLDLPYLVINDEPRFEFRGMHLEVSRNFKSKQFVKQVIDEMAAHKLNKLHFHIADDEGWRIEIPGLPELTDVGAYRCHDLSEQTCLLPQLGVGPDRNSKANGYYSVADYKEILSYANDRHIQVIPSMDMPGHSRAAIKSMAARFNNLMQAGKSEQAKQYLLHDIEDSTQYSSIQFYNDNTINACLDSSYDFITKVIDELALMHEQVGQPLVKYHIGADETAGAWIESPACKSLLTTNVMGIKDAEGIAAYFIEKVSAILAARNIEVAGWSDGMGHTKKERMPDAVQSNAWGPLMWDGHKSAHEQVNRGWDVVISSPDVLYFDFPYEADANERGYYWAARRINSKKVYEFMPENLPSHAEVWLDRQETPYVATDDKPLKQGNTFLGVQGQLWSETIRTDRQASYMIFPRLYALAERAWHKADWEMSYSYEPNVYSQETNFFGEKRIAQRELQWQQFANQIAQKVLVKAEQAQLFYRLPTAGAMIKDGVLHMNSIFPGLPMEYKDESGKWLRYETPVPVKGQVTVRTTTLSGERKSRELTLH